LLFPKSNVLADRGIPDETPFSLLKIVPVITMVIVVGLDLLVLWFLDSKLRRRVANTPGKTTFQAKFKGFGGAIAATAGGALGSFLKILAVLIACILILGRFG
jgi:hypothetical protein